MVAVLRCLQPERYLVLPVTPPTALAKEQRMSQLVD